MRSRSASVELVSVGADLSLNGSALVAVRGSGSDYPTGMGPKLLAVRRMEHDLKGLERLDAIEAWVQRFFDDLEFRDLLPGIVMFEGPGFASQVAHALGNVHGIVKLALWRRGLRLGELPPSTLKKFVTGAGNSEKAVVMKAVFKRWGFDRDDDNECDAFGCAMAGLCHLGGGTAAQQKVLAGKVVDYADRVGRAPAEDRVEAGQVAGRLRRRRVA